MIRERRIGAAAGGAVLAMNVPALACAVCYGDPESAMAKGVVAGVFTLVGVVGFVLMGIAGTGVYWLQRSRRTGSIESVERSEKE